MSSNRTREAAKPIYWSIVMMGLLVFAMCFCMGWAFELHYAVPQ